MAIKHSSRKYSIAEARDRFTKIVHEAEDGATVELTRRGESVAVLVSAQEYQRFQAAKPRFWKRLQEFRKRVGPSALDFCDEDWAALRDRSPGRKVEESL